MIPPSRAPPCARREHALSATISAPLVTDPDAFARANLRHNALALGADYALFLVGLSFASSSTILPAFATHLGAPNVVIGAIPAVMTTGWFLPSLFTAGHTETLPRRLPFVMRYTAWERVPFLVLALVAFTVAERWPAVALATMLATLLVVTGVGGLLMPAWMDIIGRTIPTQLRGRFFALSSATASAGGLAGSFVTAAVLGAIPAPRSYGVCFLIATAFMALSYVALAVVREPVVTTTATPTTLTQYLKRVPALLGRDANFAWFLTARVLAIVGAMGTAFYTVYALRAYGADERWVGAFTAMLFAGQMLGTLAFGWVADHAGHRLVIVLGVSAMAAANVLALGARGLPVFAIVFALAGVQQAAVNVSNMNILMEFAPLEGERPTYLGLGTTLVAPVTFLAPLGAGALADTRGFTSVFVTAAVFGALALVVLLGRVRDPRRTRPERHRLSGTIV
jgi:MFS family permease